MRSTALVLTLSCLAFCALSSCVVPRNPNSEIFTAEQRAALGNVELYPTRLDAEAWQGIDATDTALAGGIAHKAYRLSAGDNVVGAIGGGITRGIARGQQRDFDERNASHLTPLQTALTGAPFRQDLDKTVRAALAQTPLGAKLSPPYQSRMFVDIIQCGYRRVGLNAQDEVLLTPYVKVKILWLAINPPKLHLHDLIERWAEAPHHHTAAEFSSRADLRKAALRSILDSIGTQIVTDLRKKHG